MKRVNKILGCLLVIALVGCQNKQPVSEEETKKVEIVSNDIYEEPKDPNNEFATTFNELSDAIKQEDLELLSENAAKCFVYDFFTMKNKKDSSDVGGLTYLPQSRVEEFELFAQQHFYKNYDTIVSDYGEDALPEVVNVTIDNKVAHKDDIQYLDYTYDGYEFDISVTYAETKMEQSQLKTKLKLTMIVYEGKAMVIAVS